MDVYARLRAERSEKTGSGGGSPRKYDDLLTGPSDPNRVNQYNDGNLNILSETPGAEVSEITLRLSV